MSTVYRYVPNHRFVRMHLLLREGLLYYILRVTTRVACMLILIKLTLSRPQQRHSFRYSPQRGVFRKPIFLEEKKREEKTQRKGVGYGMRVE